MRHVSLPGDELGVNNTSTTAWATSSQLLHLTSAESTIFSIQVGDKCYVRNFSDRRSQTRGDVFLRCWDCPCPHHKSLQEVEKRSKVQETSLEGTLKVRETLDCRSNAARELRTSCRKNGWAGPEFYPIRRLGSFGLARRTTTLSSSAKGAEAHSMMHRAAGSRLGKSRQELLLHSFASYALTSPFRP